MVKGALNYTRWIIIFLCLPLFSYGISYTNGVNNQAKNITNVSAIFSGQFCNGSSSTDGTCRTLTELIAASTGDITSVTAGTCISGGATSGDATVNANLTCINDTLKANYGGAGAGDGVGFNVADGIYLANVSGTLTFNQTRLNDTIRNLTIPSTGNSTLIQVRRTATTIFVDWIGEVFTAASYWTKTQVDALINGNRTFILGEVDSRVNANRTFILSETDSRINANITAANNSLTTSYLAADLSQNNTLKDWAQGGNILLNQIGNPGADKIFTLGANLVQWRFTAPSGGMLWNFNGGSQGRLIEFNQSGTTVPGLSTLVSMNADDQDMMLLRLEHFGLDGPPTREILLVKGGRVNITNATWSDQYYFQDGTPVQRNITAHTCTSGDFVSAYANGIFTCTTPVGGGGGGDKWISSGGYLSPNQSFAQFVNSSTGFTVNLQVNITPNGIRLSPDGTVNATGFYQNGVLLVNIDQFNSIGNWSADKSLYARHTNVDGNRTFTLTEVDSRVNANRTFTLSEADSRINANRTFILSEANSRINANITNIQTNGSVQNIINKSAAYYNITTGLNTTSFTWINNELNVVASWLISFIRANQLVNTTSDIQAVPVGGSEVSGTVGAITLSSALTRDTELVPYLQNNTHVNASKTFSLNNSIMNSTGQVIYSTTINASGCVIGLHHVGGVKLAVCP